MPEYPPRGVRSMSFRLREEGGDSQRMIAGKCLLGRSLERRSQGWTLHRIPLLANTARNGAPSFSRPSFPGLLADAEFADDGFVTLGIVSLEVVEQATPLADQHEQAAARAVVLLVRFEVIRQLANAFTDDGDLNLGTPRVSRVRLILVNDRFLLLSG